MQAFDINPAPSAFGFRLWPWARAAATPSRAVLREWRGRLPSDRVEAYRRYFETTGRADYARTPGHLSTWVFTAPEGPETEFLVLTLWQSRDAIRAFAGPDIERARYYPDDADYLLAPPERVRHYDLLIRA